MLLAALSRLLVLMALTCGAHGAEAAHAQPVRKRGGTMG